MTSSGAGPPRPQLEAERALRDEDLQPVERARAGARAAASSGVGRGAVDEVDNIGVLTDLIEHQPQLVEPLWLTGRPLYGRRPQADGGAVDEQIGRLRPLTARTPSSRASAPARSGVRFQTVTSRAPASRSAQTAARALPPAPSTSALGPRGETTEPSSAAISPGASVFSAAIAPSGGERERVRRTDRPGRLARPASASTSAACLWGIVTFAPTKPAGPRARVVSANSSGGTGSR